MKSRSRSRLCGQAFRELEWIVAKALADPAVGREALASTVADWLYAEHGTVAAAAFDLLAGIACRTPVSEADTVEVLLSHHASADPRSVH